jgi:hypothetical protein
MGIRLSVSQSFAGFVMQKIAQRGNVRVWRCGKMLSKLEFLLSKEIL